MRNSPQLPVIHHTAEDIYRETEETEREKKKKTTRRGDAALTTTES